MASRKTVCVNCGPETVNISQGDAQGNIGMQSRVHRTYCFPRILHGEFIIYQVSKKTKKLGGKSFMTFTWSHEYKNT
jgi:hypothetical protein